MGAERHRRLGHRRRQQQVEARLEPARDDPGEALVKRDVGEVAARVARAPDLGQRPGQGLDVVGGQLAPEGRRRAGP